MVVAFIIRCLLWRRFARWCYPMQIDEHHFARLYQQDQSERCWSFQDLREPQQVIWNWKKYKWRHTRNAYRLCFEQVPGGLQEIRSPWKWHFPDDWPVWEKGYCHGYVNHIRPGQRRKSNRVQLLWVRCQQQQKWFCFRCRPTSTRNGKDPVWDRNRLKRTNAIFPKNNWRLARLSSDYKLEPIKAPPKPV